MIVPKNRSWLLSTLALRGSVLPRIAGRLGFVVMVAGVVTYLHEAEGMFHTNLTVVPFTLVGLALGIFLGFRNNTSYDRFWEARKLWGALVNTSRTLARQTLTLVAAPPEATDATRAEVRAFQEETVRRVVAFVHALRHHLRDEGDVADVRPHLAAAEADAVATAHNRPLAVLSTLGQRFRQAYDRGFVHPFHLPALDASLTALADIQGGCERIKATPVPFSYNVLLHSTVGLYCVTLPFGLVDTITVYTPAVVFLVAYPFFGLDAVGDEIENPFGDDPNDLPLSAISRTIERDLRAALGEAELPPPLEPDRDVLG